MISVDILFFQKTVNKISQLNNTDTNLDRQLHIQGWGFFLVSLKPRCLSDPGQSPSLLVEVAVVKFIGKWIVGKNWAFIVFCLLLNFDKVWVYSVSH